MVEKITLWLRKPRSSPWYPEDKKSRKNPESLRFPNNPGDFAKILGIKIPKLRELPGIKISSLRKITNSGDKNPETRKNHETHKKSQIPRIFRKSWKNRDGQKTVKTRKIFSYTFKRYFRFRDFRGFFSKPELKNSDSESRGSRFGIPKKSHLEANSGGHKVWKTS